ncbi:hypothetical protein BJ085DRAFT_33356 [Dimargaris cristalligena]|uniref:Uncharacterized protein n=1 Tax=Dimargaris cristalligena TaxID=215637 RepID=A0A4P9ZZL7_9FUNG|nr:hypothetical protein BJ085DRAFT_33356 [Dimargaris cristalligena]|eukprot:RKP39234.1 hypothetical protein BJ085DRAFT_33356 [Dimargaris cristalligena]
MARSATASKKKPASQRSRKVSTTSSHYSQSPSGMGIFRESFDFDSIEDPFAKKDKIPWELASQAHKKATTKAQSPSTPILPAAPVPAPAALPPLSPVEAPPTSLLTPPEPLSPPSSDSLHSLPTQQQPPISLSLSLSPPQPQPQPPAQPRSAPRDRKPPHSAQTITLTPSALRVTTGNKPASLPAPGSPQESTIPLSGGASSGGAGVISLPVTPHQRTNPAGRATSPMSAPSKNLSIDFSAIKDPFKKRDKIPMTPIDSNPASNRISLNTDAALMPGVAATVTVMVQDIDGVPVNRYAPPPPHLTPPSLANSPPQWSPLSALSSPPLPLPSTIAPPSLSVAPATPENHHSTAQPRATSPLPSPNKSITFTAQSSPLPPEVSKKHDLLPTPFRKRDKIPMYSKSMEALAHSNSIRLSRPPGSQPQTPSHTKPATTSSPPLSSPPALGRPPPLRLNSPDSGLGGWSPGPVEERPTAPPAEYDRPPAAATTGEILIPTVYKQLRRQGHAAIAELDDDMRRRYFLTDKWYARQKKMSPLMDSMYVLGDGEHSTPTPTPSHGHSHASGPRTSSPLSRKATAGRASAADYMLSNSPHRPPSAQPMLAPPSRTATPQVPGDEPRHPGRHPTPHATASLDSLELSSLDPSSANLQSLISTDPYPSPQTPNMPSPDTPNSHYHQQIPMPPHSHNHNHQYHHSNPYQSYQNPPPHPAHHHQPTSAAWTYPQPHPESPPSSEHPGHQPPARRSRVCCCALM